MEWKKVVIQLLFWTIVSHVNVALYQSDASVYSSSSYLALKKWFKLLSGWTSRAELNHGSSTPHIESSFTPEEDLRYASRQAFHVRQNSGCSCSSDGYCSTTCTSLESQCFSSCTITTEFYALHTTTSSITSSSTSYDFILDSTVTYYFYSTSIISETSSTSYSTSCAQVTCTSTATAVTISASAASAAGAAGAAGAAAIAVGAAAIAVGAAAIALAVGIAVPVAVGSAAAAADLSSINQANEIQEQVGQFLPIGEPFDNPVPVNDLPIPVPGINLPDDGCGNSSVRFQGGGCYPVLRRGPCRSPYFWVTVNPATLLVSLMYIIVYENLEKESFQFNPFVTLTKRFLLRRANAVHVFVEGVGYLSVLTDCVTTRRTPSLVAVEGYSTIRPTEIPFATVQLDSIPFLELSTTVSLFLLEVSSYFSPVSCCP